MDEVLSYGQGISLIFATEPWSAYENTVFRIEKRKGSKTKILNIKPDVFGACIHARNTKGDTFT